MKTRMLILTSLFAALTAIGAWITIPLGTPVPFTLQILFTLMSGLILGKYYGALSQIVYLLLGGIGLPVFSGGAAGFQNLVGPTGGYLWGFVAAAFVIGLITEKRPHWVKDILGLVLGLIVIYVIGAYVLHLVTGMTLAKAYTVGVAPFVVIDFSKAVIAFIVARILRKRIPEISAKRL